MDRKYHSGLTYQLKTDLWSNQKKTEHEKRIESKNRGL